MSYYSGATGYGYLSDGNSVKDRLLIQSSDTTYNTAIGVACVEGSRVADNFLRPYTTVPVSAGTSFTQIDVDTLGDIVADFSTSIFKRRMVPDEVTIKDRLTPSAEGMTLIEASGWWALAIKKMEEFIKGKYIMATTMSSVHNPQTFIDLWKQGLITAKMARDFINTDAAVYIKKIDTETLTVTKTETDTLTKNVTSTLTDTQTQTKTISASTSETKTKTDDVTTNIDHTEAKYVTRRQKEFTVISSNDNSGYEEQS